MFEDETNRAGGPTEASNDVIPSFVVSPFAGFEPLKSNWVYCPNQFFDVCLPHRFRGCVRVVACIIRRTLGYRDERGEAMQPEIRTSYLELIHDAGISRGALKDAIDEAIKWRFIKCVKKGRSGSSSNDALTVKAWATDILLVSYSEESVCRGSVFCARVEVLESRRCPAADLRRAPWLSRASPGCAWPIPQRDIWAFL